MMNYLFVFLQYVYDEIRCRTDRNQSHDAQRRISETELMSSGGFNWMQTWG